MQRAGNRVGERARPRCVEPVFASEGRDYALSDDATLGPRQFAHVLGPIPGARMRILISRLRREAELFEHAEHDREICPVAQLEAQQLAMEIGLGPLDLLFRFESRQHGREA